MLWDFTTSDSEVILAILLYSVFYQLFLFSLHTLKNQQFESFNIKTEQVIHTLENNQEELKIMNLLLH